MEPTTLSSTSSSCHAFGWCSPRLEVSQVRLKSPQLAFHAMISDIGIRASQAKPTKFHHFLDSFAKTDRLLCNLTQNIDCFEHKLRSLPSKTVQLYGRLDTLICQRRNIHTFQITQYCSVANTSVPHAPAPWDPIWHSPYAAATGRSGNYIRFNKMQCNESPYSWTEYN
jgi:hypothetical protein